jgi:hypothetical protein
MINVEPTREYPIPYDLSDHEPATHADAIAVAVNTAELLAELDGTNTVTGSVDFTPDDGERAVNLITQAVKKPKHIESPAVAKAAYTIIRQHDYQTFEDAQQARNFITNKLVELADCGDYKIEIKALELLGKHSDVGLFTNRSEITINHKSSESLENSIKERIKRLLNSDTDISDVIPLDDLDTHLGAIEESSEVIENEPSVDNFDE